MNVAHDKLPPSTNGKQLIPNKQDETYNDRAADAPPLWFNVMLVSVAVFAGPAVLALVVGLVAVCAWTCGAVVGLVRQGAGI